MVAVAEGFLFYLCMCVVSLCLWYLHNMMINGCRIMMEM